MKVLFISNYRDNTGWAHAAQSYILSMDAAGLEVVPRHIKLNNVNGEVPERIQELESHSDKNCDIVIQNVLPHMMSYSGKFARNIGLSYVETSSFRDSSWPQYLNTMDELWVPSVYNQKSFHKSGINKPVYVFPIAVDPYKFTSGYEPLDINIPKNNFIFYFIGENTVRKNLTNLLEAFHIEFRSSEPVSLVIKTSQPGMSQDDAENNIQQFIQQTKRNLKLYKELSSYKKEMLILGEMTELDVCRLHATCDCLVAPSLGESWNIPCQEAMLFGNTPVYTQGLGIDDYLYDSGGIAISSYDTPAIGTLDTFSDLCTGRDNWKQPSLESLMVGMRLMYENKDLRNSVSQDGMAKLDKYTYFSVGEQIKERINACV